MLSKYLILKIDLRVRDAEVKEPGRGVHLQISGKVNRFPVKSRDLQQPYLFKNHENLALHEGALFLMNLSYCKASTCHKDDRRAEREKEIVGISLFYAKGGGG